MPDRAWRRRGEGGHRFDADVRPTPMAACGATANENLLTVSDAVKGVRLSQNSQIYFDTAYLDD